MPPQIPDLVSTITVPAYILHARSGGDAIGSTTNAASQYASPVPVAAGVAAVVVVCAVLLFTTFGHKRATPTATPEPPDSVPEKSGYIAELEANFKAPAEILKTTAAAFAPSPIGFDPPDEDETPQGTPGKSAPPPLRRISDAEMDYLTGFNVATGKYNTSSERRSVIVPRRKQSISLDVDSRVPYRPASENRVKSTSMIPIHDTTESGVTHSFSDVCDREADVEGGESEAYLGSTNTSTTSVSVASSRVIRFKVIEPWVPQRFDELDLHVGEIVLVYQQ
ncbi:hypothetical protein BC830DRAFT_1171903 [Chytriomyces sp. MP71]|nr:hypothetical protein BC830DRAFT_1171903 [Chytriomyces sp. MP71]